MSSKKGSKKRKTEDVITPRSTNKEKRHKPETPEPSLKKKRPSKTSFPKGTWEGLVATVDTIEESRDESGELVRYVFIIWEDGDKTRHPVATVNEKCPQAVRFDLTSPGVYEHLLIPRTDATLLRESSVSSAPLIKSIEPMLTTRSVFRTPEMDANGDVTF